MVTKYFVVILNAHASCVDIITYNPNYDNKKENNKKDEEDEKRCKDDNLI